MKLKGKTDNKIASEKELVMALVKSFEEEKMKVITEVQLFERFIDILAFNEKKNCAIEAKLNSPTQAFKQASRYKIIADYTYVAIPKNKTNAKALRLAEETGIGLLLVTKENNSYKIEVAIESEISNSKSNRIKNYIMELAY